MNPDYKDILSNLNKDIGQEKLLEYLSNKMPAGEAHELEKQMADDAFMNDAVEGLNELKDKKNINAYVEQLNRDLQKQLDKKKKRREKRKIKDQPWVYFTIVLVLLLIIVSWLVVKKLL